MEYRPLGGSGLKVPVLSFGAGTFGGGVEFFDAWGATGNVAEATRLVDICFEAGVNLFDTADVYSEGRSEEVLGKALGARRDKALISTKTTFRFGDGPNDLGSSRYHMRRALEGSLRRLATDYVHGTVVPHRQRVSPKSGLLAREGERDPILAHSSA